MTQLIMNAIIAEANAKEAKAIANLQNYMNNPAGIGEHPDIVAECSKLVKDIAEAKELPVSTPEVTRMEFDMKDQMIRNTIMDTQKDVEEIKETLEKIEDKLYGR